MSKWEEYQTIAEAMERHEVGDSILVGGPHVILCSRNLVPTHFVDRSSWHIKENEDDGDNQHSGGDLPCNESVPGESK